MDIADWARGILIAQPFSRLVGAEIEEFVPGRAVFTLALEDKHQQHLGMAHGGVVATLADMALTFCGGSVLGQVLTSEFKINYLRPAIGERLVARAEVIGHGRTQAVTRCEIFACADGVEKLCAAAQGTIVKIETSAPQPPLSSHAPA